MAVSPENPQRTLAAIIFTKRTERNLTQEELAELANVSTRTIQDIEGGKNLTPRKDTIDRIIKPLRLTGDEIAEIEALIGAAALQKRAKPSGDSQVAKSDSETREQNFQPGQQAIEEIPTEESEAVVESISTKPEIVEVETAESIGKAESKTVESPNSNPQKWMGWVIGTSLVAIAIVIILLIGKGWEQPDIRKTANSPTRLPLITPTVKLILPTLVVTPTPTPIVRSVASNNTSPTTTSMCDENEVIPAQASDGELLPSQGVSVFTAENTLRPQSGRSSVLNHRIRALAVDKRGVWIGFYAPDEKLPNGLVLYDKKNWYICYQTNDPGQNIQDLAIDQQGQLWVSTERKGVRMWDGEIWHFYTYPKHLPTDQTYGLTVDADNNVWVSTWEGIARFNGTYWETVYTVADKNIFNNATHAAAFDEDGNLWAGHIRDGVSYSPLVGEPERYTTEKGLISNDLRDILIQKIGNTEVIWFASGTETGGVSRLENRQWQDIQTFRQGDGLPGNDVVDLEIDHYQRVWVATTQGVAYFDKGKWHPQHTLGSLAIAFAPTCPQPQECAFDEDNWWTGTISDGLTHARVPFVDNEKAVSISSICFGLTSINLPTCVELDRDENQNTITATYPETLRPGAEVWFRVMASPRAPHKLIEGDMLLHVDSDNDLRFGAHTHIEVKGEVVKGDFPFIDEGNNFIMPTPEGNANEQTYTSTWQVWMQTRLVGPKIRLVFTVANK